MDPLSNLIAIFMNFCVLQILILVEIKILAMEGTAITTLYMKESACPIHATTEKRRVDSAWHKKISLTGSQEIEERAKSRVIDMLTYVWQASG